MYNTYTIVIALQTKTEKNKMTKNEFKKLRKSLIGKTTNDYRGKLLTVTDVDTKKCDFGFGNSEIRITVVFDDCSYEYLEDVNFN